jgi:hypothetical protein
MVAIFPPKSFIEETRQTYYYPLIQENLTSLQYKSKEREKLQECQVVILQHLTPSEKQLDLTSENEDVEYEDTGYNSVPAKRTFTVKARVRFTGRMNPLPYSFDD